MERHWAESTKGPASFAVWQGAVSVTLPTDSASFVAYVEGLGARQYSVGEGSGSPLSVPPPVSGSPCDRTPRAIVFSFSIQPDRSIPGYVAYVDSSDQVVCVDKQFSYTGP